MNCWALSTHDLSVFAFQHSIDPDLTAFPMPWAVIKKEAGASVSARGFQFDSLFIDLGNSKRWKWCSSRHCAIESLQVFHGEVCSSSSWLCDSRRLPRHRCRHYLGRSFQSGHLGVLDRSDQSWPRASVRRWPSLRNLVTGTRATCPSRICEPGTEDHGLFCPQTHTHVSCKNSRAAPWFAQKQSQAGTPKSTCDWERPIWSLENYRPEGVCSGFLQEHGWSAHQIIWSLRKPDPSTWGARGLPEAVYSNELPGFWRLCGCWFRTLMAQPWMNSTCNLAAAVRFLVPEEKKKYWGYTDLYLYV